MPASSSKPRQSCEFLGLKLVVGPSLASICLALPESVLPLLGDANLLEDTRNACHGAAEANDVARPHGSRCLNPIGRNIFRPKLNKLPLRSAWQLERRTGPLSFISILPRRDTCSTPHHPPNMSFAAPALPLTAAIPARIVSASRRCPRRRISSRAQLHRPVTVPRRQENNAWHIRVSRL